MTLLLHVDTTMTPAVVAMMAWMKETSLGHKHKHEETMSRRVEVKTGQEVHL